MVDCGRNKDTQCGPGATEIPETKEYVIRPIYNLGGMGIQGQILEKGDT